MLRKMETGAAEETSLLEFIKSKLLLVGPGKGGWGCWALLGGRFTPRGLVGSPWEPNTMCGSAPAPRGAKDHEKVGTAGYRGLSSVGPELFPNFALRTLKWYQCARKGLLGGLTPAPGVGTRLPAPPAPQ